MLFGAVITTNYHYIIHLNAHLRTHHVITSDVHSQSGLEEFSCKTRFCDVFRWFCGTCSEFNYCPCLCELRCLQVRVSSRKINILWVHTCHVNVDTSFLTAHNDEITCGTVHASAVSSWQLRFKRNFKAPCQQTTCNNYIIMKVHVLWFLEFALIPWRIFRVLRDTLQKWKFAFQSKEVNSSKKKEKCSGN